MPLQKISHKPYIEILEFPFKPQCVVRLAVLVHIFGVHAPANSPFSRLYGKGAMGYIFVTRANLASLSLQKCQFALQKSYRKNIIKFFLILFQDPSQPSANFQPCLTSWKLNFIDFSVQYFFCTSSKSASWAWADRKSKAQTRLAIQPIISGVGKHGIPAVH